MGKLILLILIGISVYYLFIKSKPEEKTLDNEENEFIACDKCGTFVLKKEMKEKDGKLLCKECYENS
jgi:formylmethanofuran dehydrogenase subunit E